MNYKEFKQWKDVVEYPYKDESKSQYYSLKGEVFPKLREEYPIEKWKVCTPIEEERGIYIEVTPLWVTITIIIEAGKPAHKHDFYRRKKPVYAVLKEVFE